MYRVDVQVAGAGSKDFTEWFCTYPSKERALEVALEEYGKRVQLLVEGRRLRIMVTKVLQVAKGSRIVSEYEEVAHFNADLL